MKIEQSGGKIIITIDVSDQALAEAKPSTSGKTLVVASTNGFQRFGKVSINLNCTVPNPAFASGSR